MSDPSPFAPLAAAAEHVRQQLNLPAFDAAAVQQLSRFAEVQRRQLATSQREAVASALGCFLGQCVVESLGGVWANGPDGTTGVRVQSRFYNPFAAVARQLAAPEQTEVVAAFFALIAANRAKPPVQRWI